VEDSINKLLYPKKVFSRKEVLSKEDFVPAKSGIYGFFFKSIPPKVPTKQCITFQNLTLLYVGISPDIVNKPDSKSNIKKRLQTHYSGNASGSTLRKTLGVLLEKESGYPLRRVGSGKRTTLTHLGEQWLDQWMDENLFVNFIVSEKPNEIEDYIIDNISLPLNIKDSLHPFSTVLSQLRSQANLKAKNLPIADESGTKRKL